MKELNNKNAQLQNCIHFSYLCTGTLIIAVNVRGPKKDVGHRNKAPLIPDEDNLL